MTDVVSPVLVGRERELTQLRASLARTVSGEPGVVLVGGEAGVGKSRLLDSAVGGSTDVRVLTGGCVELGGEGLPFVPLVESLRALVRTTEPEQLDRLLGPARPELARLLPELSSLDAPPVPGGSTAQLFELVLGVLGRKNLTQLLAEDFLGRPPGQYFSARILVVDSEVDDCISRVAHRAHDEVRVQARFRGCLELLRGRVNRMDALISALTSASATT